MRGGGGKQSLRGGEETLQITPSDQTGSLSRKTERGQNFEPNVVAYKGKKEKDTCRQPGRLRPEPHLRAEGSTELATFPDCSNRTNGRQSTCTDRQGGGPNSDWDPTDSNNKHVGKLNNKEAFSSTLWETEDCRKGA